MDKTKLTVHVPRTLLEKARHYARQNDTTLTRLVSSYLQQLPPRADPFENAPVVKWLTGILSQEISERDYYDYLGKRYRNNTESVDGSQCDPGISIPVLQPAKMIALL